MRVRVGSRSISNAVAKNKKGDKWKKKRSIHRNLNGRIQLKDLAGKSYMQMGFHIRIPLKSRHYRIIDLSDGVDKKKHIRQLEMIANFEFRKRSDRIQSISQMTANFREKGNITQVNESHIGMLDATGAESMIILTEQSNAADHTVLDDGGAGKPSQNGKQ